MYRRYENIHKNDNSGQQTQKRETWNVSKLKIYQNILMYLIKLAKYGNNKI